MESALIQFIPSWPNAAWIVPHTSSAQDVVKGIMTKHVLVRFWSLMVPNQVWFLGGGMMDVLRWRAGEQYQIKHATAGGSLADLAQAGKPVNSLPPFVTT
jgi:hypothetical protein